MTDDYKQNILKYLTGNFEDTKPSEIKYVLTDLIRTDNNLINEVKQELNGNDFEQDDYILMKDSNNNYNGRVLLYGHYTDNSIVKGAICLLDNELNLIQVFTSYSSGTELNLLLTLQVANDGSLYGIEKVNDDTNRFIMLNNPSVKLPSDDNYKLTLRRAYFLQGNVSNIKSTGTVLKLMKAPNTSNYLIVGKDANSSYLVTTLKINVGEENKWIDYTFTETPLGSYQDSYAEWSDDSATLLLSFQEAYRILYYRNSDTEIDMVRALDINEFFMYNIGTDIELLQIEYKIVNLKKAKLLITGTYKDDNQNSKCGLQLTEILSDTIFTSRVLKIIEIDDAYIEDVILTGDIIELQDDITFLQYKYNVNAPGSSSTIYSINLALPTTSVLFEKSNQNINFGLITSNALKNFNILNISNQYNLYNINYIYNELDSGNYYKDNYQFIFNLNDYPYIGRVNINSLVPNSAILLDDKNVVLFARNLYNKTVNNNTTLSVLEIPNSFLNDITISKQELWGMNNNILTANTNDIVKNIYETLYLNFNNTIIIKNSNDEANEILNIAGAGRLNRSMSIEDDPTLKTNYNNAKANKIRVNYNDNTNIIINSIPSKVTDTMYMYDFDVYVPSGKTVNNIEIISNDESTIYQEIDDISMESSKLYNITQCVEII